MKIKWNKLFPTKCHIPLSPIPLYFSFSALTLIYINRHRYIHWPIGHALVELRKQEVVVELVDALDVREYLWNYAVWKKMLLAILVQQLIVKHLHFNHQTIIIIIIISVTSGV